MQPFPFCIWEAKDRRLRFNFVLERILARASDAKSRVLNNLDGTFAYEYKSASFGLREVQFLYLLSSIFLLNKCSKLQLRLKVPQIINPLPSTITLVILLSSCYTLPCSLVKQANSHDTHAHV